MGCTFAAALVKKTGAPGKNPTAPATRKALREGLERMGYTKAANAEDAALRLPLHHDKKSAWLTIALEMPEDLDKQTEFLRKLAAETHTPILYFMNFDSDFLYVAATDGKAVQHVHVGFIDEDDDAMTDSDDLSIFDALLPDETARAEFRRILAVEDEERVFSEEAAQEMAALFGYTPEALFIDEDAEPFAVLGFDAPGGEAVPFLMPEDALPAFTKKLAIFSLANPTDIRLNSCGGANRGIRITLQAMGYDAEKWDMPVAAVRKCTTDYARRPAVEDYWRGVPERVRFTDGSKGWRLDLPEVVIERGVNMEHPQAESIKAMRYHDEHALMLWIALTGTKTEPSAELRENKPYTRVFVAPLENPQGFAYYDVPLREFRKYHPDAAWMQGYID